jgi:hypothetical protein
VAALGAGLQDDWRQYVDCLLIQPAQIFAGSPSSNNLAPSQLSGAGPAATAHQAKLLTLHFLVRPVLSKPLATAGDGRGHEKAKEIPDHN